MLARGARADVRDQRYGDGVISLVRWEPQTITLLCKHGADPLAQQHNGRSHLECLEWKFEYKVRQAFDWTPEAAEAVDALCGACIPPRHPRRTKEAAYAAFQTVLARLCWTHSLNPRNVFLLEFLHCLLSGLAARSSAQDLANLAERVLLAPRVYQMWSAPGFMLMLQCRPSHAAVTETLKRVNQLLTSSSKPECTMSCVLCLCVRVCGVCV